MGPRRPNCRPRDEQRGCAACAQSATRIQHFTHPAGGTATASAEAEQVQIARSPHGEFFPVCAAGAYTFSHVRCKASHSRRGCATVQE